MRWRVLQCGTRFLWLSAALLIFSGCEEPSEVLARHFEEMAQIAEGNAEDCELAGERLGEYLTTHQSEIEEQITQTGQSSRPQANRIAIASRRIDAVVEPCRETASVQRFTRLLSEIVLTQTELRDE